MPVPTAAVDVRPARPIRIATLRRKHANTAVQRPIAAASVPAVKATLTVTKHRHPVNGAVPAPTVVVSVFPAKMIRPAA